MTITGLAKKLRSIVGSRLPRLVLLISRPVEPLELQQYSMIFDEVAVERSTQLPTLGGQAEIQTANVFWATRVAHTLGPERLACEVGCAIRTSGMHGEALTLQHRGCGAVTMLLTRKNDTVPGFPAAELKAVVQTTSMGVILAGDFKNTTPRPSGAEFVLIEEGDDLRRFAAEAVRAGLYELLLGGPTGLES